MRCAVVATPSPRYNTVTATSLLFVTRPAHRPTRFEKPTDDFADHLRKPGAERTTPADVIDVDGILLFADERVRTLCDVKVHVDADPDIRLVRPGRDTAGRGWIGLRHNADYVVTGVERLPLLPAALVLLLGLGAAMLAWWREGR